jgi:hypothetical protein
MLRPCMNICSTHYISPSVLQGPNNLLQYIAHFEMALVNTAPRTALPAVSRGDCSLPLTDSAKSYLTREYPNYDVT